MVTFNDLNQQEQQPQTPPTDNSVNQKAPLAGLGNLLKPIGDIPLPVVGNVGNVAKSVLPLVGAVAGGIGGAAAGAPSGPGAFLTGVAGAGAGGELGELDEEQLEKILGFRKDISPSTISNTATASELGQGVGEGLGYILPKAMALFTGKTEEYVNQILTKPETLTEGYKGGREGLNNLVKEVSGKIGAYTDAFGDWYDQKIAPIANNTASNGEKAVNELMNNVNDLLTKKNKISIGDKLPVLPKGFNVGDIPEEMLQGAEGAVKKLDFSDSTILKQGGGQELVNQAYKFITDLGSNPTVQEVNNAVQSIGELKYDTSAGDTKGGKIVGKMYDAMGKYISKNFPELDAIKGEAAPVTKLMQTMRAIFPENLQGKAVDQAASDVLAIAKNKITDLGMSTAEEGQSLLEGGKEVGKDIYNYARGAEVGGTKPLSTSQYIRNPQTVMAKALGAIPNQLLKIPVAIEGMGETGMQGVMKGLLKLGMSEATMKTIIQDITQGSMKN